jgi:hypothetical protein
MNQLERMQYLVNLVDYNPKTGSLTWKRRDEVCPGDKIFNIRYADKECGTLVNGYMQIRFRVDNQPFMVKVHRLVWFIVNGKLPEKDIDHINGEKLDNRIINLRDVPKSVNSRNKKLQSNNTSGITGVSWNSRYKKWVVQVRVERKHHHLGYFDDINTAEKVVIEFRKQHGFTNRHGELR